MSLLSYRIFGTIVSLCCLTIHGREECESGKYGDGCSRNCSQGCKAFRNNEVRCHKETGKCFEGCNAGVYGNRCDQQCSRNCKEHTCILQNGHCVLGCIENHIGDFCETYQPTTVVHQGTTYSSHTTVTTGVAPTSSSQVVIPVVVTVLVLILILVGAVIFFIWRRKEKKKGALDTNVEKRSSPGAPDPDDVVTRLLPGERVSPRQPRSPGHEPTKLHRNRKGNMSTRNPFELLQDEFEYLKSKLQLNGTKLIDHLFAKKVLTPAQMEEMNVISGNSKKIEKLVLLLTRRPAGDFDYFMEGLEEDQSHIKEHLQTCIMKIESANTGVEMEDDHEDMDGNTGEDRRINLKDIKTAEKIPNLEVSVTVVHRDKIEMRNGKEQFMAEVADKTSAVDICVTNRNLFDKIKVQSSLFLENVSWSGNVIFLNEKSKATSIAKIEVDPSLVEEAFGRGEVVSIQKALALKPKLWVALKGKIVKQSVITKKSAYERKLLTHRQIKLADRSGSMYVDVWEDLAVNLKSGDVIHMTGCKRKKSESVDVSSVTTTRKTIVKKLQTTEFDDISIAGFAKGTL